MIYDIDGVKINHAYDLDGTDLAEAFDIDGNSIFRRGKATGYSIENVQSYYQPRTLEVTEQINALSDDWQSFIFVTDPHYPSNEMHSQSIALYLLSNSSASMIVLGGDYCEGSYNSSRYKTWTAEFRESENKHYIHALFGNHERFGGDQSMPTALNDIYSDFLSDKVDDLVGNLEQDYYYFDDSVRKIRYMFINTSDGTDASTTAENATTISATQLAWVREVVQLPDSTWSLIVLAHVNMMYGTGLLKNKADLIAVIETCNGSIVGYICGHQHADKISKISDGFYELTLLCDRFSETYPESETEGGHREAGTYTEQAVSVVSFNTITKQVVMRRIGAGNDQVLSYSYAVES